MEDKRFKILLIEDDHDDAEMIMYSLRKLDFIEVVHLDDGERALQFLFEELTEYPSLILLDLKMPKVDGIQILRALKRDEKKRDIPVAALISSKEGIRYVESYGLSSDTYLMKPLDSSEFLRVLVGITVPGCKTPSSQESIFETRDQQ